VTQHSDEPGPGRSPGEAGPEDPLDGAGPGRSPVEARPGGPLDEAGPEPPRRDKRWYFALMGVCVTLFVLSWAVVDRYSVPAAVAMSAVALLIPPLAAIVANRASAVDRRRP
jgi:hypothetical protein